MRTVPHMELEGTESFHFTSSAIRIVLTAIQAFSKTTLADLTVVSVFLVLRAAQGCGSRATSLVHWVVTCCCCAGYKVHCM